MMAYSAICGRHLSKQLSRGRESASAEGITRSNTASQKMHFQLVDKQEKLISPSKPKKALRNKSLYNKLVSGNFKSKCDLVYRLDDSSFYIKCTDRFTLSNCASHKVADISKSYSKHIPTSRVADYAKLSSDWMIYKVDFEFTSDVLLQNELSNETGKMLKVVVMSLAMMVFFIFDFLYLMDIVKSAYENYRLHLLNAWLIPILINIIIMRFIIIFTMSLVNAILCFRFWDYWHSKRWGWVFKSVVASHTSYMYQVRNLITKYKPKIEELN